MKICHITTVHKQNDVRIFHKECTSLAKKFKTTLLVVNGKTETINNVSIKVVKVRYRSRISRFLKVSKALYEAALKEDAKIYHFHDPDFLPYAAKLKRNGKMVIYDVHEDLPRQILSKYWIPIIFRKLISRVIEKYENHIAKKLDFICTSTPFIRDRFLKINPETADINNFPIIENFRVTKELNFESLCYIGGITSLRGIKESIIASKLCKVKINIAGSYSPENYKSELKKLKEWDAVIEHGHVNSQEINKILSNSFAGMVTLKPIVNYIDSLPIKMFEYMAAGLPVISSDFPLWKTIVEKNDCGICVDPENPNEIAKAIEFILKNPEKAKKMGQNGRRIVEEKYNWTNEEFKLINIYKKLGC